MSLRNLLCFVSAKINIFPFLFYNVCLVYLSFIAHVCAEENTKSKIDSVGGDK